MTQREFDAVCPRVSPTACCVYIALVTCRNARTSETPEISTPLITLKTGKSRSQVFEALKELREGNFLTSKRGRNGNYYGFPFA